MDNDGVTFHFLNVGGGDCTIVYFPPRVRTSDNKSKSERIMMVDIYHRDDDNFYEDVIDYYKRNFKNSDGTIKPIFRFVCTHPHQDHICGLRKLFEDSGIDIINFWDIDHSFEPENFDGHPTHEEDWDAYDNLRGGKSATVIKVKREDEPKQFWGDGEDRISILSPSRNLIRHAHYKDDGGKRSKSEVKIDEMSYCLSININGRKVILAGDGRATPCWDDIYADCRGEIIGCWVLKAGHHGHETSFHEDAVKTMAPALIIFSNSEEEDEANGAEHLYAKAVPSALILKTWEHGSIVVKVPFDKNEKVTYLTER